MVRLGLMSAVYLACVLTVAAAPVPPAKEDPALADLRKEKLRAAEDVYAIRLERHKAGTDDRTEDLYEWSKRWLESEKEVNPGRDAALKAVRAHLERMKELETLTGERMRAGIKNITTANVKAATYARKEAEIWLKKAEAESK
jgi:hypothetical protein